MGMSLNISCECFTCLIAEKPDQGKIQIFDIKGSLLQLSTSKA